MNEQRAIASKSTIPLLQPLSIAIPRPAFQVTRHVNILCASLARGGAERQVVDLAAAWEAAGHRCKVMVFNNHRPAFTLRSGHWAQVVHLHGYPREERARVAAQEVIATPQMFAYTILIRDDDLRELWRHGISTAPVVVNAREAWQHAPAVYDSPHVPFVVAVSGVVADQLRAEGLRRPIQVIRHEVTFSAGSHAAERARVRSHYGVSDDCLLIGMVGQFKAQKAYPRAVRVLKEVQRTRPAKLMIVGGWDHAYGFASHTYAATLRQADQLGCHQDLLLPGNVEDVAPYYAAFDVFLNTSLYEGLSIATLEAQARGCAVVTADAGGQREALREGDELIGQHDDDPAYAAAILRAAPRSGRDRANEPQGRAIVPHVWQFLAHSAQAPAPAKRDKTLFLTANLNIGGAQRSLVNLVSRLGADTSYVGVLNHLTFDGFYEALQRAAVPTFFFGLGQTLENRLFEILSFIRNVGIGQIVFWNVDAPTKLLLTKSLAHTATRLVEVSPGPMLFRELDQTKALQHRIAFDAADYFARLDRFVAKYAAGAPPDRYAFDAARVAVIPNGVPSAAEPAVPVGARPPELITVTRIVPNKQIVRLITMLRIVKARVPDVSLTIVGGVEQRHVGYWETLMDSIEHEHLDCVRFAGPSSDIRPLLDTHRVFVMMSKEQGCPNASLEAMAAGLPVVANNDGGTAEQVLHGATGFLAGDGDPASMASLVERLLRDDALATRFGAAGRAHVLTNFAMDAMVTQYRAELSV